jgi:hypothetical protein
VQQTYDVVVPDVLASIYSMEEPVLVPRLTESVWQGVEARFDLDQVSSFALESLRARTDRDVDHIFDAFEALGAVTSSCSMTWPVTPVTARSSCSSGGRTSARRTRHRRRPPG